MSECINISKLCGDLNISSRTLRYYEEVGLINSIRDSDSLSRKYTCEEQEKIRKIIMLRGYDIPVSDIKDFLSNKLSLPQVIKRKLMRVNAEINELLKLRQILNEADTNINNDKNIFTIDLKNNTLDNKEEKIAIAMLCTKAILEKNYLVPYEYFCSKIKERMPENVLISIWRDATEMLGDFLEIYKTKVFEKIVYVYLKYEYLNLELKYIFYDLQICGFWINYIEKE